MLIGTNPSRITLHHNLFVSARQRNPLIENNNEGTPALDTVVDMRNNLVWVSGYGTSIKNGATANVVNNFYWSSNMRRALEVKNARAYVSGNYPPELNGVGTEATPFPAPKVNSTDACSAAHEVLAGVGARPLDLLDGRYLSVISLPSCP
jgi:hypothetical protein